MLLIPSLTDTHSVCKDFDDAQGLVTDHSFPALFTQYSVIDQDGQPIDMPRQNRKTLSDIPDGHAIAMTHLIVDMDIRDGASQKRVWQTGEYSRWLAMHVEKDLLGKDALVYPTTHGARLIWRLSSPYLITDQESARIWSGSYLHFIHDHLGVTGPGGETADTACNDWTRLFFLPKRQDGVDTITPIRQAPEGATLSFFPAPHIADTYAAAVDNATYDVGYDDWRSQYAWEQRLSALDQDPMMTWGVENSHKVTYHFSRGLGTNINALLGDRPNQAEDVFLSFCRRVMGKKYDKAKYQSRWRDILASQSEYAPYRYSTMIEQYPIQQQQEILEHIIDPLQSITRSCLSALQEHANQEWRVIVRAAINKRHQTPKGLGPYLSAPEVYKLLLKKLVGPKNEKVEQVIPNIANLKRIFIQDKFFEGAFSTDVGRNSTEMYHGKPIDKGVICDISEYVANTYRISPTPTLFDYPLKSVCKMNVFYEVQDYLMSLQWDGVCRVDDLVDLLRVTDRDYARIVLRKWMIASVVRPYRLPTSRTENTEIPKGVSLSDPAHPQNRKVDNVLILRGSQASGKSTFMERICPLPEYFQENLPPVEQDSKDASMQMSRAWLVDWGEFEHIYKKASVSAIKAFVTRQVEDFRPPYGRTTVRRHRTATLVGSTNNHLFLNDPTGSRRFWVLEVGDGHMDTDRIEAIREQVWAQAVAMLNSGEAWWFTDPQHIAMQRNRNDSHTVEDATQMSFIEYMEEKDPRVTVAGINYLCGMTSNEIHRAVFQRNAEDVTTGRNRELTEMLLRCGYTRRKVKRDGAGKYVWLKRTPKMMSHRLGGDE